MAEGKEKNLGIELLRIVCMLMIVVMHLLYKGGVLYSETLSGSMIEQAWFLEAFCYVAVNAYVITSGWLLVSSQGFQKKRGAQLWLLIFFYSAVIGGICYLVFPQTKGMLLVKSLLPVLSNSYWFMTSYLLLYVLHPFINRLIKTLEQKNFRNLLFILGAVFCVWPNLFPFFETLDTGKGYSFIWFVILYLTGAYLKLYPPKKRKPAVWLAAYALLCAGVYLSRVVCLALEGVIGPAGYYTYSFYTYNSMAVYPAAIFLFLAFSSSFRELGKKTGLSLVILFFSQVTLDVYLIHEQIILRDKLWTTLLPIEELVDSPWFLLIVLGIALAVLLGASLTGQLRKRIVSFLPKRRN